jgi:hypothetical protein
MKKLLLVLLVVTLASFLFVGCLPTTPAEGEGEGEGEGECETTVEIDGAVVVDGKTYVSCGNHTIAVTFCAPVVGYAEAYITCCTGDYSTMKSENNFECGYGVVLFPNVDRTVWTGSGYFGCNDRDSKNFIDCDCCASYVEVWAGECEDEACIWFPVIVDCRLPFAEIEVSVDNCECAGCELTFESIVESFDCEADEECCGDWCSGLASWSIVLYDGNPFDECCDPNVCEEPIGSCSDTDCPIECVTECLEAGTYYVVVTLVDAVGLEEIYYARIVISGDGSTEDCDIDVYEAYYIGPPDCVDEFGGTTDTIGYCFDSCLY